jgi:phospholipid/cholesterol/gamma-HCH transport system permease protein
VKFLERIGRWAVHLGDEFKETLSFLGETLLSVLYILLQPRKMHWTALVSVMEDSGLDAVPIVAFLSFFVGMVVAFIGASTLAEFGATIFVVELVGIAVLREFGVVLAAIILVGRTNSAFTAQIGAMKMRQEIDAMTTLGLDPMDVIVAPRVLAMVLMTPVLAFVGVLAGLGGGVLVGWLALDINPTVFFGRMQDFVPLSHFWVGMSKAPFFGLVIALIGCRQGLQVGGSVQSLGQHTTKSVVQAIFAIIVIDALFAILYMELDI